MRQSIAGTMRCTPASVTSLRVAAHRRVNAAATSYAITASDRSVVVNSGAGSASSSRATYSTSAVTRFPRTTAPRLAASEWGREARTTASSSKEAPFPPTLATARPVRRRSGRSSNAQSTQSDKLEGTETQSGVRGSAREEAQPSRTNDEPARQSATAATLKTSITSATADSPLSDPKATSLEAEKPQDPNASQEKKTILARIKGLWETFKYLFRFYWNGIKQIWKNREVVREMKKEITMREAAGQGGIRWTEKATIELHRSDMLKLPLFAAICLILEEIIPLVVLYAPSLLPSTCVLPSQSLTLRAKEEQRRCEAVKRLAGNAEIRAIVDRIVEQSCSSSTAASTPPVAVDASSAHTPQALTDLNGETLKDVADVFGLRRWGSVSMLASRIDAHLRFLQADDAVLQDAWRTRSNGDEPTNEWLAICSGAWLWRASGRRGLRASAADEAAMEHNMESYLHLVERCTPDTTQVTRALLPLALYDGTEALLERLKRQASTEADKGLRQRTAEVVQNVVEEAKRSEAKAE